MLANPGFNLISQLSEELERRPPGTLGDGTVPTAMSTSPERDLLATLGEREGSMFAPLRAGQELRTFAEPELKDSVMQLARLQTSIASMDVEQLMDAGEDNLNFMAKLRMRLRRSQDPLFDAKMRLQFQQAQANVLVKINEQLNMSVQQLRMLNPESFAAEDEFGKAVGKAVGDQQALAIQSQTLQQLVDAKLITQDQAQEAFLNKVGVPSGSDLLKQNMELVESVSKNALFMPEGLLSQLPENLQPVARMAQKRERERLGKVDRDQYKTQLRGLYEDGVKSQLESLDAYGEGYFIEKTTKTAAFDNMFEAQTIKRVPTLEALRTARLRAYVSLKSLAQEKGIGVDEFEQQIGTTFEDIQGMTQEAIGAPVGQ